MLFWPFLKHLDSKWFLQMYDDDIGKFDKFNASFPNNLVLWKKKNSIRFFCSIIRTKTHYTTFINHNNNLSVNPTFITDKFYHRFSLSVNWTDKNHFTNECLAAVFYYFFILSVYISFVLVPSLSPFIFNRDGTVL